MSRAAGLAWRRARVVGASHFSVVTVLVVLFAAMYLFAYLRVLFCPVGVMGTDDMWMYHGPNQFFMDYSIHEDGVFPLWNPLTLCGMPFAANPQSMLLYPPNLVRSLLVVAPTPFATHVSLAVLLGCHFVLMGLGTFFLARRHGCGNVGSTIAAVSFAFSGLCVSRGFVHPNIVYYAAWTPLVLLFLHNAALARGLREWSRWGASAIVVLAVQTLVGYPLFSVYLSIVYFVYFILVSVSDVLQDRGPVAWRGAMRRVAAALPVFAAVFVGGALIASIMLLPATEMAAFSQRQKDVGEDGESTARTIYEIPTGQCLALMWYFGKGSASDRMLMMRDLWEQHVTVHLGVILAGLAAWAHRRRASFLIMLVMTYMLVDMCLGPPMPVARLAQWLAPFEFSATNYAAILIGLPLSVLAGLGVDAIASPEDAVRGRRRTAIATLVGALAILVLLMPLPGRDSWPGFVAMLFPALALAILLLPRPVPKGLAFVFVGVLFAECLYWSGCYCMSGPEQVQANHGTYKGDPGVVHECASLDDDNERDVSLFGNANLYSLDSAVNGYDPVMLAKASKTISNPGEGERYSRILWASSVRENPRVALLLKRPFWLAREFVRGNLPPKTTLFPPTSVAYLQTEASLPVPEISRADAEGTSVLDVVSETKLVAKGDVSAQLETRKEYRVGQEHVIFELGHVHMPPAHSAVRLTYSGVGATEITLVARDTVSGEDTVLGPFPARQTDGEPCFEEWPLPDLSDLDLEADVAFAEKGGHFEFVEASIVHDGADENTRIRIVEWSANASEVELRDLPAHRVLVFTDVDYPGWKAYLDGVETPIYPADDAFKAVVVPPGTHQVRFEFRPDSVWLGAAISGTTLLAVVVFVLATQFIGAGGRRAET